MRGNRVYQPARVIDAGNGGHNLRWNFFAQLDILVKLRQQRADKQAALLVWHLSRLKVLSFSLKVFIIVHHGFNHRPRNAFYQHLYGTVRQAYQLQNGGDRANTEQIVCAGLIIRGVFLSNKKYLLVIGHRDLKRFDRFGPTHKERLDDLRIDHYVSEGEQGVLEIARGIRG